MPPLDADGWYGIEPVDAGFSAFFGTIRARRDGPAVARLRFETDASHGNLWGGLHGGFLLAVVDQALFVGPAACGRPALGGATVDVSSQFLARAEPGKPIDAVTEILRETGRMLFLRGLIEQEGEAKLAFSGTIRKPSR